MKISDYRKGTEFVTTCVLKRFEQDVPVYGNFEIDRDHCGMWGCKPEDVKTVRCRIVEEDVLVNRLMSRDSDYDTNSLDYFAWIEFEPDGTYDIKLIFPNIKVYFCCFPYTPDVQRFWKNDMLSGEKKGQRRGMSVRLEVEEISPEENLQVPD